MSMYSVGFERRIQDAFWQLSWLTLPILLPVRISGYRFFHVHTERWRFVSKRDLMRFATATLPGTVPLKFLPHAMPCGRFVPRPGAVLFQQAETVVDLLAPGLLVRRFGATIAPLRRNSL